MKNSHIWLITGGCLALLTGAMGWTTWSLLSMERAGYRMDAEARVQERVRLALWRMESLASAVVVEESARPAEHYRAFRGDGAPSPLLLAPAPRVLLHFEMDADGRVSSPQAPEGADLEAARRLELAEEWLRSGENRLAELRTILSAKAENTASVKTVNRAASGAEGYTNQSLLQDVNSAPAEEKSQHAPMDVARYAPPQQAPQRPAEAKEAQELWNQREALRRSQVVDQFAKANTASVPPALRGFEDAETVGERADNAPAATAAKKRSDGTKDAEDRKAEVAAERSADSPAAVAMSPNPAPAAAPPARAESGGVALRYAGRRITAAETVSDFRPLWIRDALLLTRRATSPNGVAEQGAWLDWPALRAELLGTVSDLFPEADLAPASGEVRGASLLASLPVRFLTGAIESEPAPSWTPLRLSLSIAWLCVLAAAVAVSAVVRGMLILSARRASFVSSVTHELRTPLATFKLYSEMLADGMVRDPEKRQRYLETLTTEADRLGHLVENVLSYSRLEGGKGPSSRCRVSVGELLERVAPRLRQRASHAGAVLTLEEPDHAAAAAGMETDPSAVEQIIFNLVDNACKYGRTGDSPPEITVTLGRAAAGAVVISVCDHGPGIAPAEVRKLFRPFHKSAREAAHSAPGVGLGLSLCRRLAKELGGKLEIDLRRDRGACFRLQLPAVADRAS